MKLTEPTTDTTNTSNTSTAANANQILSDQDVEYLFQQYPWFSREEIQEAMRRFGYNSNRVITYLDLKSGSPSLMDFPDW